ncbi:MAG: hypothetical protein AAF531_05590 [Actinomycetota bacterium]
MTPVQFDSLLFAPAWLNASIAASEDDENQPALYRSVSVEWFQQGVQLISTDSTLLIGAWVPSSEDIDTARPDIDEAPIASYVVRDTNKRMASLMKFAHGEARAAEKDGTPAPQLTLSVRSMEADDTPTLSPAFDRLMLVAETDRERLALPVFEAEFANWRSLLSRGSQGSAVRQVAWPVQTLGRLGGLRDLGGPLVFTMAGKTGATRITAGNMFGALSPAPL